MLLSVPFGPANLLSCPQRRCPLLPPLRSVFVARTILHAPLLRQFVRVSIPRPNPEKRRSTVATSIPLSRHSSPLTNRAWARNDDERRPVPSPFRDALLLFVLFSRARTPEPFHRGWQRRRERTRELVALGRFERARRRSSERDFGEAATGPSKCVPPFVRLCERREAEKKKKYSKVRSTNVNDETRYFRFLVFEVTVRKRDVVRCRLNLWLNCITT